MKRGTNSNQSIKLFQTGERNLVVPLHHPKPSVAIGDLRRTHREWATNRAIVDIRAWNFKKVAGCTVQLEWPNHQNKYV